MTRKKFILTVIIGTLTFFIWNAVSWMALPFHTNSMTNIPENAIDFSSLKGTLAGDGVYHYPGLPENNSAESQKKIEEQLQEGPRVTFMVYKEGPTKFFDPEQFIWALLINLITVLLVIYLLSGFAVRNTKTMVLACLFIGLIIAFVSDISLMNWYMFPWDYTLANLIDRIIPFLLLGLLIGSYTFKNSENLT